jgi:hypothetical protein
VRKDKKDTTIRALTLNPHNTELNGLKRYDGILRETKHSHNKQLLQLLHQRPTKRYDGIFLPHRYYLHELHEWNPNSIWILNLRGNVQDWMNSVISIKQNKNMPSLVEQFVEEMKIHNEPLPQKIFGNNNHDVVISKLKHDNNKALTKTVLEYVYNSPNQIVRDFCKQYNHRLIEVNITNANAGIELITALGWDNGKDIFDYEGNSKNDPRKRAIACWGQHSARQPA